jgi:3-oxoacyl-[acyl-carrier-protein] synthase II|tara:strand:+ start:2316 stop:3533 length:1218 start_codon:yes stop_codon:yes gene_type:complete
MGAITPLGIGVDTYWEGLIAGRSGISIVTHFDVEGLPCQIGAQVDGFEAGDYMDLKDAKRYDRCTQFAVAASRAAWAQAGLEGNGIDPDRVGCIVGSGIGGIASLEEQARKMYDKGPRRISPFLIPQFIANMPSGVVAIELDAKGPNMGIISACATATHALGDSIRILRAGEADVMIAGGTEASITPLTFAGFTNMKAMTTGFNDRPEAGSRPFDALRNGFVMGEGAGVLILETLEHATARGATILAELAGHGATCDANHITSPTPDGDGLARSLRRALNDSGVAPSDVDYVNAHGTSTPLNDKTETVAMKNVFGDHASKLHISSTKSMTGHLLGATGGIEAIACMKALETGIVPPTINYENPDPDCDLNYTPNVAAKGDIKVAASNNLGFGGQNASVVFRRWEA